MLPCSMSGGGTYIAMPKFADFLSQNKIDPRRLLAASRELERLRPQDRAAKLAKRQAKAGKAEGGAAAKDSPLAKPRSGRPVTLQLIESARTGKPIAGPAKTRLIRAVNRILEQKKLSPAELRTLF